jgi:hypothetical protein
MLGLQPIQAVVAEVWVELPRGEPVTFFDREIGAWQLLDGPAEDYTLGDTRKRLLEHLRGTGGDTPMGASVSLKIPHETAKKTLARMAKDEQIDTNGHGTYYPLPGEGLSPRVPAVPRGRDRDSGDSRDRPRARWRHRSMTTACAHRRCERPVSITARDGKTYCGHHADRLPPHLRDHGQRRKKRRDTK